MLRGFCGDVGERGICMNTGGIEGKGLKGVEEIGHGKWGRWLGWKYASGCVKRKDKLLGCTKDEGE